MLRCHSCKPFSSGRRCGGSSGSSGGTSPAATTAAAPPAAASRPAFRRLQQHTNGVLQVRHLLLQFGDVRGCGHGRCNAARARPGHGRRWCSASSRGGARRRVVGSPSRRASSSGCRPACAPAPAPATCSSSGRGGLRRQRGSGSQTDGCLELPPRLRRHLACHHVGWRQQGARQGPPHRLVSLRGRHAIALLGVCSGVRPHLVQDALGFQLLHNSGVCGHGAWWA